jgi:hypothetical protein
LAVHSAAKKQNHKEAAIPASRSWACRFFATKEAHLRRSPSHHKMHDQRDHREQQQKVYQGSRYVEDCETTDPRQQQNHEQDRPDTH